MILTATDDVERASELQRLEIFGERHAFAIAFQSFFIDRFKTEEHGVQAEPLPEFENFLVAQQHVAARFEVITFLGFRGEQSLRRAACRARLE